MLLEIQTCQLYFEKHVNFENCDVASENSQSHLLSPVVFFFRSACLFPDADIITEKQVPLSTD